MATTGGPKPRPVPWALCGVLAFLLVLVLGGLSQDHFISGRIAARLGVARHSIRRHSLGVPLLGQSSYYDVYDATGFMQYVINISRRGQIWRVYFRYRKGTPPSDASCEELMAEGVRRIRAYWPEEDGVLQVRHAGTSEMRWRSGRNPMITYVMEVDKGLILKLARQNDGLAR